MQSYRQLHIQLYIQLSASETKKSSLMSKKYGSAVVEKLDMRIATNRWSTQHVLQMRPSSSKGAMKMMYRDYVYADRRRWGSRSPFVPSRPLSLLPPPSVLCPFPSPLSIPQPKQRATRQKQTANGAHENHPKSNPENLQKCTRSNGKQ